MRRTFSIYTLLALVLMAIGGCGTDGTVTNSIGMEFKLIPAGEFLMGNEDTSSELAEVFPEAEWAKHDLPRHMVHITKPFYLGVTEVTQEQYEKVMGKNPSWFSKKGDGANAVKGMDTSSFPVEQVSWDDAMEFCKKLSAMDGHTYRLPTEAEWEYACRADSRTAFSFGDDKSRSGKYVWSKENSEQHSHSVGRKKPNAWGLRDMHGNVWEWCSDWYDAGYYATFPKNDPPGPATGSLRVKRGGGWRDDAWICVSSFRHRNPPSSRDSCLGFRVVMVPSGK